MIKDLREIIQRLEPGEYRTALEIALLEHQWKLGHLLAQIDAQNDQRVVQPALEWNKWLALRQQAARVADVDNVYFRPLAH